MDLYVASWEKGGGKTTLSAGIGRWLKESGKRVGYLSLACNGANPDACFMKSALELEEPVEAMAPCSSGGSPEVAAGQVKANAKKWRDAVSSGKDVTVIEGMGALGADEKGLEALVQTVGALEARVIVVINYAEKMEIDRVAASLKKIGQDLIGVVVNRVPQNRMESARAQSDALGRHGVKVLCLMPEDRILFGVTLREMAERLEAESACCNDRLEEMVHNVMIGVMTSDSGRDYFVRKDHKAVIVRGERPDMQLAALSTPTAGLILTGGRGPVPQVKAWAEEKHVPILVTKADTLAAASEVESTFVGARFHHGAKLTRLEEILRDRFDFQALRSGLGLAG